MCGGTKSTPYVGHYLAYCTSPGWWMSMTVHHSVEWMAGEAEVLEKSCSGATLSTKNPTWHDLGSNPGHRRRMTAVTAWATIRPFAFMITNEWFSGRTQDSYRTINSKPSRTYQEEEIYFQIIRRAARMVSIIQTKSVALSPRANYTDWSATTCRRNLVPTFADRGM
jgi:hypothetical protein